MKLQTAALDALGEEIDISKQDREVTPTVVENPDTALEPLYEKEFIIDENNNNNYVEINAEGKVIQGTERERQSVIKEELKPYDGPKVSSDEGAKRGIIIDEISRKFLNGDIESLEELTTLYNTLKKEETTNQNREVVFHEKFLKGLHGILSKIKSQLSDYKVYSDLPVLWGELGGRKVAAKIDLLLYNKKTKTFSIVDLKTSARDRAADYANEESSINYKLSDKIQLSIYSELLKQVTGIDVDATGIWPITTEKRNGEYYKATMPDNLKFVLSHNNESIYDISAALESPIENSVIEYPSSVVSDEIKESTQDIEQDNYDTTQEGPSDKDPDDIIDEFLGRNKNLDNKATREQIREAKKWYDNHPLNDKIKYQAMFNIVNSKNWAEFTKDGIYLYQGANFTDLYHEAWHGFSQMFMTVDQKKALYESISKKGGSFTNYRGDRISFKKATPLMLEEHLAEEFRKYVLSKGTKKIAQSEVKSIFQKILDFLKGLFGFSTLDQVMIDPQSNEMVKDLFEKLRLGEINDYTYSLNNQMFSNLSSGFKNFSGTEERSFQDAQLLNETIDSLISEFIDKVNAKSITKGSGRIALAKMFSSQESLSKTYEYVLSRLKELRVDQVNKFEINSQVEDNIDLLNFAINNFGTYSQYISGVEKNGTIAFHQKRTKYLNLEEKIIVQEDTSEKLKGFDRTGTELSVKELASNEILYLLKGLYEADINNPDGIYNKLGVKKPNSFGKVWNHTLNLIGGQRDSQKIYEMLINDSEEFPIYKQLVERLGNPKDSVKDAGAFSVWSKFMEAFNRTKIPLIQLTVDYDSENSAYNLKIGEASSSWRKVRFNFLNSFNIRPTDKYIKRNKKDINYLDVNEVVIKHKNPADNPFQFFVDIGFNLDERNPNLMRKVNSSKQMKIFAQYALKKLQLLNKNNIEITNIVYALENNYTRDIGDLGRDLSGNTKVLSELVLKYSDEYSSGMVTNAVNEQQYEYSLQNSLSVITNALNNANSFEELTSNGFMSYLSYATKVDDEIIESKNPFTQTYKDINGVWKSNSQLLNSLFDFNNGVRGVKRKDETGKPVTIHLNNLAGVSLVEDGLFTNVEYSSKTKSTDIQSKLITDFHTLLTPSISGVTPELLRHASKSSSFSIGLSENITVGKEKHLNIDTKLFISELYGDDGINEAVSIIIPYISSELERIKRAKSGELDNVPSYKKNALDLTIFKGMLPSSLTTKLKKLENNLVEEVKTNDELKTEIKEALKNYFDKQAKAFASKFSKVRYISPKLFSHVKNTIDSEVDNKVIENAMYKSFVYNKFIKDFETMIVFYGDSAQYKTALDYFKRNAGIASTGRFPRTDPISIARIKNMDHVYTKSQGGTLSFDGTFVSAVFKDQKLDSIYYPVYEAKFTEFWKKEGLKGKALKDKVKEELDAYLEMEVGDAQGWITFDSYRIYQDLLGRWSPKQEEIYQKIASGEYINPKTLTEFFPPKKVQYWGPLKKNGLPVKAFHKLSLVPLIPSVIKNSPLEELHNNMVKQGINYGLYETGSKLGTITKDGQVDDIFQDEKQDILKPINKVEEYYTQNVVYLEYLKDQLDISTKFKGKVTFSTQLRKLIELGLWNEGVPADVNMKKEKWDKSSEKDKLKSNYYKFTIEYEKLISDLTNAKKDALLEQAGGDITSLLNNVILPNLERGDLSVSELNVLKTNSKGELVFPLGMTMSASRIEKLLVAVVNRQLVRQNTNGEMLVQVSNSMFTNNDEVGKYREATDEEKFKYKGTLDLPSYLPGETTSAAKVKIALKGDFVKLLRLDHLDGESIKNRKRLNDMIKDEEWLKLK